MNGFEEKRDKTKAFKASQKSVDVINNIIKKSGKNDIEFFEDLVNDLSIQQLVKEENEEISVDLRKHFESDVQKLKNATSSILSIFISQMENISVEKNQWQAVSEKQLQSKQDELDKQITQNLALKGEADITTQTVIELEKVSGSLSKERDALEKRTIDQEQLIQDRNERIEMMEERVNKLNETVVAKDEQLKESSAVIEQNKVLEEGNDFLQLTIDKLKQQHKEELAKTKEQLLFACEKEKHKAETALLATFHTEKENLRNETRKETELAIREFYLQEIQRKEQEMDAKEEAYRLQIQQLQQLINNEKNE